MVCKASKLLIPHAKYFSYRQSKVRGPLLLEHCVVFGWLNWPSIADSLACQHVGWCFERTIWVRHSGGPPFRGIIVIITLTLT